jgi:SAM-dependent methyltransferase
MDWKNFWNSTIDNKNKIELADLLKQVKRTINKQPVPKETLLEVFNEAYIRLNLNSKDILMDLCCGNGFFTSMFSKYVSKVIGVDFADQMIDLARVHSQKENVTFIQGNIVDKCSLLAEAHMPNKILMMASLAYFSNHDLQKILEGLNNKLSKYLFFIGEVPNDNLKWNFYNTEERKARYFELEKLNDDSYDGLGRWWKPSEIENICKMLGLEVVIENQNPVLSNYRMNIIIEKK